jgi:predicted AAA+ superfamily ATPase
VASEEALRSYPKCGASWEGFALEQVMRLIGAQDAYFWAIHSGPELDLFIQSGEKRYGFEFKFGDAPKVTGSMQVAVRDLALTHLFVVFPGDQSYPAAENITVVALKSLSENIRKLYAGVR